VVPDRHVLPGNWLECRGLVGTIMKLTREFGLTPAACSRIFVNPPADDGEAELWRILSKPRVKAVV
jgi:hypothetical protein